MKRLATVAVLAAALAAGGPVAYATFVQPASATSSFSTGTLSAPSGLTATRKCGLLQYEIHLAWTASPTTWADGYEVSMATSSGGPYTVVPLPLGGDPLATTRVVGGLLPSTTYWFRVTATAAAWRSSAAQASQTTSALCVL